MNHKKIGILTFHASHNYGSMLQAYALYSMLERIGHNVQIINFRGIPQKMMYPKPYKYWDILNIKNRLLHPIFFLKNIRKWNKFESFIKSEMTLTHEVNYFVDIRRIILDNEYDAVITGSDQIWNFNCIDFSVGYLLPFKLPCKKIAYAPSMGQLQCLQMEDVELFFKSALADYDYLSAREVSMAEALSQLLQKPVNTVPDPTWMIPVEEYDKISCEEPLIKGKYLYYYRPHNEHLWANEIYQFAKKQGLKAVCSNSLSTYCPHFVNHNDAGPKEFLNLIKNAEIVCGYSMHMAIFALLFHKPFFVITEKADTRINDLLKSFGLEDRIVSSADLMREHNITNIDWMNVDTKIAEFRSTANDYLTKAL